MYGLQIEPHSGTPGLYRGTIVGPGASLTDAFAIMESSPQVERLLVHSKRDLLSARVTLPRKEGTGYWELTRIRNQLYVILTNCSYKEARLEFVPGDGLLQLNYMLSGDMTYGVSSPGPLRFNRPSLHLWRQPPGSDMREWTAPGARVRMVSISFRTEFLLEQFLLSSADVPRCLQRFVHEGESDIDFYQLPLTAQMLDITSRLIENPYIGALYLSYKEALISELLCSTIGTFQSLSEEPVQSYSDRELHLLSSARRLLMKNLDCPRTIRALARSVGMGEKALTAAFTAIYGESPFDFSVRVRMQHALVLLCERSWPVDRVAEAVGYSHPTSFTVAFRRHFGLRPIDVKRLKTRGCIAAGKRVLPNTTGTPDPNLLDI